MRLGEMRLEEKNRVKETFTRPSGSFSFFFEPVMDYSEFDAKCPMPKPVVKTAPDGSTKADTRNPEYIKAFRAWSNLRTAWTFLKSISATPDLHWDTVDLEDPETWGNWESELQAAQFTSPEIGRMMDAVMKAGGFKESMVDDARKDFLALLGEGEN